VNQTVKEEVDKWKTSALGNRNTELYDDALSDLDEAIHLLDVERAATALGSASRDEVDEQLADCYGIKGGIYRRTDRLTDALKMYQRGQEYERLANKVAYNRTNIIALSVMIDGNSVVSICDEIERVIELVDQQRREDESIWWSYANLGLLYLLVGQREKALDQYQEFITRGAQVQDVDTTVDVLERIRQALAAAGSPLATDVLRAIKKLNPAATA
jgi:tetratricopeptide (TPR) repeat protein